MPATPARRPALPALSQTTLLVAALLLWCLSLAAQAAPLLTPEQLAARLAQSPAPRVLDIRGGKDDAGRPLYEVGHIEGALPAPYGKWRGPADNPGQVPANDKLTALLQSLGIDAATPVVIVHEGSDTTDFGAAARVYWTLKAAGVKELSILNGGMNAWRAAKLPLSTAAAPKVAPTTFEVKLDPKLVATREEVAQAQQSKQGTLLDARPARFFTGETRHAAASTPGTIAGAKNIDNAVWFNKETAAVLDAEQVKKIAADKGVDTTQPTVSFCNTGHWAATNWFVLSEVLGQPDVKLYPESMVDWSKSGGAMDNVPSRLYQFWLQVKQATGNL